MSEFNLYSMAVSQWQKAVDVMDLEEEIVTILSQPKNELMINFPEILAHGDYRAFKRGLEAVARGQTLLQLETEVTPVTGPPRQVELRWAVPPGPAHRGHIPGILKNKVTNCANECTVFYVGL